VEARAQRLLGAAGDSSAGRARRFPSVGIRAAPLARARRISGPWVRKSRAPAWSAACCFVEPGGHRRCVEPRPTAIP
jgi:hypothetical protein